MPDNYALPSSSQFAASPWVTYFNSLPTLSKVALDMDDGDTTNVYKSVESKNKGQSYRGWLSSFMPKYHDDYLANMYKDPTSHYVDWLSSINPDEDYKYASNFEKGLPAGGITTPTMRMNWG
jgi:hypothetical protein